MEYQFVPPGTSDLKRKRPHAACDSCKKKKKRCFHGACEESTDDNTHDHIDLPLFSPPARPVPHSNGTIQSSHYKDTPSAGTASFRAATATNNISPIQSPSSHRPSLNPRSSRFVGDTHAEANLEIEQDDPSDKRDRDNVGIWFDDDENDDSERSQHDADHQAPKGPLMREADRHGLIKIFVDRVQPLLPILEHRFTNASEAAALPETLSLAVCLVASKDERARPYMRFQSNPSPLPVHLFARKLYKILLSRLQQWRTFDRLALIRTLALVSTHQEGPDGIEESSLLIGQAIQHAYLLGIHLKRNQGNIADPKKYEDTTRLFWSLWSLDKLCAAINGRPRMAYEMDVGLDFTESLNLFGTAGRLWLKLARLLSSVNDLYNPRPCVDTESHIKDFPRWEFLLEDEDVRGVDEGFLTTLELFYHSVSMLSCRIKFLVGRKRAFASSLRRYLSAATVYAISKCVPAQDLAPLPVVPYAYCLGTLVAYQQYRCAQRQIHRTIAEEKLVHFQEQLQAMASCWYAAKSMARKSQRVLRESRRNAAGLKHPTGAGDVDRSGTSHVSTISNSEIPTPDSFAAGLSNGAPYQDNAATTDPNALGYGGAFADMDMMFGNLMDMNAFTGDIEFALDPNMIDGYDPAMWAGEGISAGV